MTDNFNEEHMDENFEEMLENSLSRSDNFSVGDSVQGKIIFITDDSIFVDISGKSEAILDKIELLDKKGNLTAKVGDTIDAFIVSVGRGEINLTTKIGKGHSNPALLEMAYTNNIPVYGTVTDETKGGYNVSISNNRCFCPASQMDIKRTDNPEDLINSSFLFKIIQYSEKGKNIILSRRALLEETRQENEEKLKESLKENDVIKGKITSIQNFGIFIDIGGIEALVPKSELSWSRHPEMGLYKKGNEVTAKVKNIDWENKKISLSIKETTPHPWENVNSYSIGSKINGRVVNIINNGAFVELEPGVEGFIHISNMSYTKRINKPEDVISNGENVTVKILNINSEKKKISLELCTGEANPWDESENELKDKQHTGIIEISKSSGINVRLSNGLLGFIPRSELINGDKDIQKEYPVGNEITATVVEINRKEKNLILSEKGAKKSEEMKDFKKFQEKNSSDQGSSLGALFKNQFDKIQKEIDKKDS